MEKERELRVREGTYFACGLLDCASGALASAAQRCIGNVVSERKRVRETKERRRRENRTRKKKNMRQIVSRRRGEGETAEAEKNKDGEREQEVRVKEKCKAAPGTGYERTEASKEESWKEIAR